MSICYSRLPVRRMPRKGYFNSLLPGISLLGIFKAATAASNFPDGLNAAASLTFNVAAVARFPETGPDPRGGLMRVVLPESASGAVGPVAIPISAARCPQ
jgi:hypothetical protein